MSRYHVLTDAERCELYDKVSSGEITRAQAATDFDVSLATVGNILRKFAAAEERRAIETDKQKFIAGNRQDGNLTKRADQDRVYEGSCRLPDGRFARKRFRADGDLAAKALWSDWCGDVRAGKVRQEAVEEPEGPEPFAKQPFVMPTPMPRPEPIPEPEKEEPMKEKDPQAQVEGCFLLANTSVNPPRFRLYRNMEAALQAQEEMERAASFMGFDPNVEVYEVGWGD